MNPIRKNVALLYGGRGYEHEISVRSAEAILSHMDRERFFVYPIFITKDGAFLRLPPTLRALPDGEDAKALGEPTFPVFLRGVSGLLTDGGVLPIDLAIPALHGDFGEDGRLQGLLDAARIRYVGEGVLTGAVATDKAYTKYIVEAHGVPTVPFALLSAEDGMKEALQKMHLSGIGFPVFLKPTSLGSSVGAMRVDAEETLAEALAASRAYGRLLLESYIAPLRELEISAVYRDGELRLSTPAEIVSAHGFYDYDEKYREDTACITMSPCLPEPTVARLLSYARTVCEALGVRMLSRLDFFLAPDGALYFNEINTFPGFTDISLFPRQMTELGMDFGALLTHLCEVAYAGDL